MKQFEQIQQDILSSKNKKQLVSAGAGSGKTTVMIGKIANLLLQGADVNSLLVVTFTTLATNEMKERLINKLNEELNNATANKETLINIIEQIKTASIDTIDGFSSKTIKKYFYALNISPNIEIMTDSTKDYYLSLAMKKTIKEFQTKDLKMNILLDLFGGNRRSVDALVDIVLNCYYNVINIENYEEFLDNSINEYIDNIKSEKIVNDYICKTVYFVKSKIMEDNTQYPTDIKKKIDSIIFDLQKVNFNLSLKTNLVNLFDIKPAEFTRKDLSEFLGLKDIKESLSSVFELIKKLKEIEKFEENNQKIVEYYTYFIEFLKIFIKNYNNIKKVNNLIDFNDLNRLMLKLLQNDDIKQELNDKYKYIFVDEYQDVNPLQDSLIKKLTGKDSTLFTVGDVKQSIYGFRGSNPEWFLQQYNNLKQTNEGDVFDMNVNFRTSPTILNFVNEVFTNLMTVDSSDINYKKDCLIDAKRKDIVDEKVKILLVKDQSEKALATGVYSVKNDELKTDTNVKRSEALLVLKTITELIDTDFYDANKKEIRKLSYKDIAILTHSEKDEASLILIDLLKENAVPLKLNNQLKVSKNETIKLILSILKCVANLADDVDYLATFLSLTSLTIDDIASLRNKNATLYDDLINADNEQVKYGFSVLEKIKKASFTKSNSELIRFILNEAYLKYYILSKPNGEKELNVLEEFLQKLSYIENNANLYEFIEIVESNISKGSDFASADDEDSVSIMTVHKSKGLEFPVVILFESSKRFSYTRDVDLVNFNQEIGFGVDYFDRLNRTKSSSLTKYAIKLLNSQKGYKEELRLLYVALTRAKNKLIITGSYTDNIKEKLTQNSFTNMLLSCYIDKCNIDDENEFENCNINFYSEVQEVTHKSKNEMRNYEIKALDFVYEGKNKFNIPFKNTVTALNTNQSEQTSFKTKDWLTKTMQYTQTDIAYVGTLYHKALEKLDFNSPYIQTTNFDEVDYEKIKQAHNVISKLAKNCVNIKKEADFMMYLPYNELVKSNITDKVLVQGVVDLLIEHNDGFIIVDYKFSSLKASELKQKYLEQLSLYKMAVEKAYNKKVKQTYIYAINSKELI